MLCSCVGHAALFGGFLLYSKQTPPRRTAPAQSTAPLVVELIPLDHATDPASRVESPERKKESTPVVGTGAVHMTAVAPASGPVRIATRESSSDPDIASAPDSGGAANAASAADLSEYQRRLYEVVASHSRYPAEARQRRLSGITLLAFRLDRLGNVLDSWVQKSSGSEVLDNAALAALERAQPLPPIPPALPSRMDFEIEIDSSVMQQVALLARQ
jgi:protein TonB